jgi:bifunctional DNA-binding transcriptional regulator/antitoxin component of YhaV-PrlF toxin-antitoxin module
MRRKAAAAQGQKRSEASGPHCARHTDGTSIYQGIFLGCTKMNDRAKKYVRGHVSSSGRLSLPAEFRKEIGLERGGDVIVELDGKDIRIRTVQEAVARAQAMSRRLLAGKPALSVDDFLAHRREDWGEE